MSRKFQILAVSLVVFPFASEAVFSVEKPCPKSASVHKEKNLSTLRKAVESAATNGDVKKLKQLSACDFGIGIAESDVGGFRRAASVMPDIAKALKGTKWKTAQQDYGTDVMVESETPPNKYVLQFRKDEKAMWYWSGLNGVTDDDVAAFRKGSYQLSGAGEED
jgi:hypothetical protein